MKESLDFEEYASLSGTRANFIIDEVGAYEIAGSSRGLGNQVDRKLLIHLRSLADAVIIGGQTARAEKYIHTQRFETYVFSRQPDTIAPGISILDFNSESQLQDVMQSLRSRHQRILIEAGPTLLSQFLRLGLVDELCLTVTGTLASPSELVEKVFGVQVGTPTKFQKVADMQFARWNL